jgi:hypothetical protein
VRLKLFTKKNNNLFHLICKASIISFGTHSTSPRRGRYSNIAHFKDDVTATFLATCEAIER